MFTLSKKEFSCGFLADPSSQMNSDTVSYNACLLKELCWGFWYLELAVRLARLTLLLMGWAADVHIGDLTQ